MCAHPLSDDRVPVLIYFQLPKTIPYSLVLLVAEKSSRPPLRDDRRRDGSHTYQSRGDRTDY